MKYLLLLFITISLALSCQKQTSGLVERNYIGEAYALKNGVAWEGRIYGGRTDSIFSITFQGFSPEGFERGKLRFRDLPLIKGSIPIRQFNLDERGEYPTGKYSTLLGGDAFGDIFKLIEDAPGNNFEVTEYQGKDMKGTFTMTFEFDDSIRSHRVDPNEPSDTIVFTNGVFSVTFEE